MTRILVVDDEPSIRESLARQLTTLGYDVTVAASAVGAMAVLHDVNPDIIITDVRMPDVSGLDFLSWVREHAEDVDVLVMTAFQNMRTAIDAMKAGAYDYLVKPLDLDHIELVLARCVRDRVLRRRVQQLEEAAEGDDRTLVGADPRIVEISKLIGKLATNRAPVLIRGETGTGKEVVARAIHYNSSSSVEPFVAVNCTAVPEALLESELFGHLRGSFTGATSDRKGRFELAGTGTIFLDEIGDVTAAFQAKLLRVLQNGEFYPVGAERARQTSARVIAATHRPLEQLVRDGKFREDLYFRLHVVEILVPPLRERRADIPLIAEHLLARAARTMHLPRAFIPPSVIRLLESYDWPGNVRELENALTRALALAHGPALTPEDFALGSTSVAAPDEASATALDDVIRAHVERVLAKARGNKAQAARMLNVSRARLDRILAREDEDAPERSTAGNES